MRHRAIGAACLACTALTSPTVARSPIAARAAFATQAPFATQVVDYSQGPGGGLFDPLVALGGPLGGGLGQGSLDVVTLGEAGSLTLGFDVALRDGPGADLAVFENGFIAGGGSSIFAELAHVEVSTDGVQFARLPSVYAPPAAGGTPIGTFGGLCGGTPVLANVAQDPASPFDPVTSGGEALDLAALAGHPLVLSGQVDLSQLHYVRLVDVGAGDLDSVGTPIPSGGTADIDAVALLHTDAEPVGGPICDLDFDGQGYAVLDLGDPDGFFDLDLATVHASLSLAPLSLDVLLALFTPVSFDGSVLRLRSVIPVQGAGLTGVLAVSTRDASGAIAGDQLAL